MKRTKITLQPNIIQIAQIIELNRAKGKVPEGRTFFWLIQNLIDSILAFYEENGTIKTLSQEEAEAIIAEFRTTSNISMDDIDLMVEDKVNDIEQAAQNPQLQEAFKAINKEDNLENLWD